MVYGPDPRQKLDIYVPTQPGPGPLPVIVFFYGGNWDSGDKELYSWVGRALAAQGFVTVLPAVLSAAQGGVPLAGAKVVISDGQPVTTEIAELTAGPEDQPRTQCSFCGKRRDQTAGLVMSSAQTGRNTAATICNECLDLCTEIITEELG